MENSFLNAWNEIMKDLTNSSFSNYNYNQEGFVVSAKFTSGEFTIKFLYGPPEYEIEMIIYKNDNKTNFKDLLQISEIKSWVNQNKYIEGKSRNLKRELLWFIDLFNFSEQYI